MTPGLVKSYKNHDVTYIKLLTDSRFCNISGSDTWPVISQVDMQYICVEKLTHILARDGLFPTKT